MQSKAATVEQYLASLPEDRRKVVEAVRKVIKKNLGKGFEEGMQYGMIGYYVPHTLYPAGYHCDPRQPLPFAGLASQKAGISLYLFCLYIEPGAVDTFVEAWKATGKKLDMGKSCVRFKRLEDAALEPIGAAVKGISVKAFIATYEAARDRSGPASRSKASASNATTRKAAAKKAATKKPAGKRPAAGKARAR
jgi:hypothetical protein